jgi:membrane protein implicated in regulation of membrane protease activity
MSARKKMNSMYVGAAALLAAFIGLVYSSWWVSAVALAVLLVMNVLAGNIRPASNRS